MPRLLPDIPWGLHPDRHDDQESPVCRPHPLPGIHALDNITVNDILVPRSDVDGINLDDSIEEILEQLRANRRTRLPVFHSDINQVEAVLNTRLIQHLLQHWPPGHTHETDEAHP